MLVKLVISSVKNEFLPLPFAAKVHFLNFGTLISKNVLLLDSG